MQQIVVNKPSIPVMDYKDFKRGLVVWFQNGQPAYKLHRVIANDKDAYAFIDLHSDLCYANGIHTDKEELLIITLNKNPKDKVIFFDNFDEFIDYCKRG